MKPYILYYVFKHIMKEKRNWKYKMKWEQWLWWKLLKINQDKDGGFRQILRGFNIITLQLLMSKILKWIKSLMKITKLFLCKWSMTSKKLQAKKINLRPKGNNSSVEERISTIYEKTSKMDKRSNQHGRKTQQGNWDFV